VAIYIVATSCKATNLKYDLLNIYADQNLVLFYNIFTIKYIDFVQKCVLTVKKTSANFIANVNE